MPKEQQDVLMRVEHRLMAPCCYTQTIDVHLSDIAEKMRHEVASMILVGQEEGQIYEHYKAIYGEQILAVPDGTLGIAAFTIPAVVSTVAASGLLLFLYRLHRRKIELRHLSNPITSGHRSDTLPILLSDESKALRQRIRAETSW